MLLLLSAPNSIPFISPFHHKIFPFIRLRIVPSPVLTVFRSSGVTGLGRGALRLFRSQRRAMPAVFCILEPGFTFPRPLRTPSLPPKSSICSRTSTLKTKQPGRPRTKSGSFALFRVFPECKIQNIAGRQLQNLSPALIAPVLPVNQI